MRTRPITLGLGALALAGLLAACGGSAASETTATTTTNDTAAGTPAAGASAAAATAPAAAATGSTADISFAQLMIPHHQQAVQMAELAITNASSPDVQKLAEQIKAAQDPEIQAMESWLATWGVGDQMQGMDASAPANGDMGGMDMGGMSASGMMTQQDLDKLAKTTGADFDRMWLQMMIAHHQGAVTMAQQVLDTTSNADVQALAQAVVDGQTTEIDTMQQLLAA
jgi:uncharacterized protein (DUF305 family)